MVQVDKSAQPGLFSIWIFPYLNIFLKAWPLTIDQIDNKQMKYMCKFPKTIFFSTIVCCTKWWHINQWNLSIVSSSFCRFWFFSCCLCLPAMHQQWLDCNKSMPELSDVRSMKLGDWAVWVWTQVRRYYPTTDRDTQYTFWICLSSHFATEHRDCICGESTWRVWKWYINHYIFSVRKTYTKCKAPTLEDHLCKLFLASTQQNGR